MIGDLDSRRLDPELARLDALRDADALAVLVGKALAPTNREIGARRVAHEREGRRKTGVAPFAERASRDLGVRGLPAMAWLAIGQINS